MKKLAMIAGPNGAGKTTMAEALLTQSEDVYADFLNADKIAQGLSPLRPESVNQQAGKLMIRRFHDCLASEINFAFETTASGLSYATHLKKAKETGYSINLIFLWLNGPDLAIKRVAQRVKQGGHDIPTEDIIRRYYRGLKNLLERYLPLANTALILDNSLMESNSRKIIARKSLDTQLHIEDDKAWETLQERASAKV